MSKYDTTSTGTKIAEAFFIGCFALIVLSLVLGLFYAFAIMLLWNAIIPDIFHLGTITFWQAWGLYILSNLLFKSFNYSNGKT